MNPKQLYQVAKQSDDNMDNNSEDLYTIFSRTIKRPTLFFHLDITNYCNLNCKSCGSYSPLAEKKFDDVKEIKKSLERLSDLSGGICHHINILGGEPLLHPELLRIIRMTRDYFPVGSVFLVTNGTLLLQQKEEFWETCRRNNVIIAPTHYPIEINYEEIQRKVSREGCKYRCSGLASDLWFFTGIGEDVNSIESKRFLECIFANDCGVLKDGKIYMCPKPAKVDLLNKEFGTDFKVTEKDYIDIFKINDVDEIMEFLAKPIPFCRYCGDWKKTEWGISKKEKEEWLA